MIIIIPLGGIGSRFKKCGYTLPKPLINVMGKPILYWLLDRLDNQKITKIIIPYNKELAKYRFEDKLKKDYNYNFQFIKLLKNTEGAAETISVALNEINDDDCPILCLDGDNFYMNDIINQWNQDNCVFTFEDTTSEPIYSYVNFDGKKVTDIVEKEKISDLACSGAYGFESWKELQLYCQNILINKIKQKNEYYTSTVIKQMIKDNKVFNTLVISIDDYICLGTPLHVRIFCNNLPKIDAIYGINMTEIKRYCFDLDNTLVTFPKVKRDYTTVEPIKENIKFVRYLKKFGHTIIIYTARRMKTHHGNQGKLLKDIGKITFDTLEKFNIPYDEIYFGKPQADFYIDDLAICSFSNLEKELGYYQSRIEPRSFNSIKNSSIQTFKKNSNDLSGEIHYYQNIPNEIKDMFPIMINFNPNQKSYEMEKVNGIPISKLYLDQELTIQNLDHILNSIIRIHSCKFIKDESINIYDNYIKKLKTRYENYDYSQFHYPTKNYYNILENLIKYDDQNKGHQSIIHGDPVFTNILINSLGKIKFIDMRGKQGDKLSIQGDALYDWAKIYQSLIGYEEILGGVILDNEYKNKLIEHFLNKFTAIYGNEYIVWLQVITKSLLFSLIPLHKENSDKFYQLMNSIK